MQMDCSLNTEHTVESKFSSDLYQLSEKIGEGGFGQVYKAVQTSTQQTVAIKFLTLNDDFDVDKKRRYIERFHRESDLIRRLNHPNIVKLIDKGEQSDSLLYAVYEYIDGHSLKEQLDTQGPLSAVDASEVMASVLDALSHAHDQGVIHRDIKPANIMLYKVGAKTHVKVLDFGIGTLKSEARQLDYKSITLTQETLGTPSYSAPEQLRGEPPVAQTDIYVWGLVFLECLTGTPTITGSSLAAIFHQQLSPSNVPLGILAGHNSANFFRRVLNKKVQERPENTAELYHDFCQLNFSNLVGDLSEFPEFIQHNPAANEKTDNEFDETIIHEGRFSYSRLTERKQISVLSIILTTQAIHTEQQQITDHHAHNNQQDVIDTFHADQMQQCIDIAIRYGANHVGSLGDTLLFYFGYPLVTDNDSRLCSRAALEISSNVNKKNSLLKNSQGITSQVQMGVEIGLMLSLANNLPEGKAAHDAMNLCRKAQPGQILCSENVKHILEGYLNFEGITTENLNEATPSANTQALYQLRGERQAEAFGFLRGTRKNRAFIGREQEISTLMNVLHQNDSDIINIDIDTQIQVPEKTKLAHVHGEAGIGKSRLVFELRDRTPAMQHFVAQCLPEHQNNALYPILNLLKFKYSLDALSAKQSVERLKQEMALTPLPIEHQSHGLLVLAAWLNLDIDIKQPKENILSSLSPEIQKQRLFSAVSHLLCKENQALEDFQIKQHLFIFEDLHWADPTSKEFINYIIQTDEYITGQHAWINTSREALPDTMTEFYFSLVPLNKLAENETLEFIKYLFDQQILAKCLTEILIERTDGIPLFIEELASTLQKQKLVHKVNGIIDFVDNEKQSQVPATLRDSLQQRLDGLKFAKDTAQLAATIGRAFGYDLLTAASDKDEAQVQMDLDELIKAELVYQQRQVDGDSYIFKHALVRDAAYESMDNIALKYDHNKIANTLVTSFPKTVNKYPAEVARHFAGALCFKQAIHYGTISANSSLESFSIEETIYQSNKVLSWILYIDSRIGIPSEIEINSILVQALMSKYGWGHKKVSYFVERSKQIFPKLKESQYQENFIWSLASSFLYYYVVGEINGMIELHNQVKKLSNNKNNQGLQSVSSFMNGFIYMNKGQLNSAEKALSQVIKLYDKKKHSRFAYLFGLDILSWTEALLGIVYCYQGKIDESNKIGNRAIAWAKEIGHVPSLCTSLLYRSISYQFNGDKKQAKISTDEIITLANTHSLPAYIGYASLINLWSIDNECATKASEIVHGLKSINCNITLSFYASLSAEAYIRQGNVKAAIQLLDECLLDCQQYNEFHYEAELYRRRAIYFMTGINPKISLAKSDLKSSIALAKSRGNNLTLTLSQSYLNEISNNIN